jgi:hypothetical protein
VNQAAERIRRGDPEGPEEDEDDDDCVQHEELLRRRPPDKIRVCALIILGPNASSRCSLLHIALFRSRAILR